MTSNKRYLRSWQMLSRKKENMIPLVKLTKLEYERLNDFLKDHDCVLEDVDIRISYKHNIEKILIIYNGDYVDITDMDVNTFTSSEIKEYNINPCRQDSRNVMFFNN